MEMGFGWIHLYLQLLHALFRNIKAGMNSESVFTNRLNVWLKEEKES